MTARALLAVLMLALCGCALLGRTETSRPLPPQPPPAEIVQARLPPPRDPAADLRRGLGAALALLEIQGGAHAFAFPWQADLMLESVALSGGGGRGVVRARALYMRAALALQDPARRDEAASLLEASMDADPAGPLAVPARTSLDLLAQIQRLDERLRTSRQETAEARKTGEARKAEIARLEEAVATVQRQLDDLKTMHLRLEQEKQDTPPSR